MNKLIISLLTLSSLLLSGTVIAEGSVARAIITTNVAEREPVNDLERVLAGNEKVSFFTELRGMAGQKVRHRWSFGGEMLAEIEFNVGGPRWRVWSSKKLMPEWAGEWTVEVVDAEDNTLSSKSFEYAGAATAGSAPAAADEAVAAEAPEAEASEVVEEAPVATESATE
jgi:hypothetical protein